MYIATKNKNTRTHAVYNPSFMRLFYYIYIDWFLPRWFIIHAAHYSNMKKNPEQYKCNKCTRFASRMKTNDWASSMRCPMCLYTVTWRWHPWGGTFNLQHHLVRKRQIFATQRTHNHFYWPWGINQTAAKNQGRSWRGGGITHVCCAMVHACAAGAAGETCIFYFDSPTVGSRVWRLRRQSSWVSNNASCAQSSRLYQKSRHRYNVLVQLFLSDPHPHSWDAAAAQPAQESYAVAAFFYCWNRIYVRPALIFCQSHEEFGCCFWFHMAHCTIHASSANKAENSSALLCLMCHAALRMLLVCVSMPPPPPRASRTVEKIQSDDLRWMTGICHCLLCAADAIYLSAARGSRKSCQGSHTNLCSRI
jgi:hypothetical protein